MLNNIILMGCLTRDPDLRYTKSELPVCSFTIAVDRDFENQETGERQADFIDCVAWRQGAEFVAGHFQKGSQICVNGRLQMRNYTDKEGNARRASEVLVNNVYFCGGKKPETQPEQSESKRFEQHGTAVVSGLSSGMNDTENGIKDRYSLFSNGQRMTAPERTGDRFYDLNGVSGDDDSLPF